MVEAAGIEPASETVFTRASPGAVHVFFIPSAARPWTGLQLQ